MKIWGISESDLRACVQHVSRKYYGGNIVFKREPEKQGRALVFTLTVRDSSAKGGRRSNTGRKIAAACWHAHRDIMRACLRVNPACKLKSMLWQWHGLDDFESGLRESGERNIGSRAVPCCAADACTCEHDPRDA